MSDIKIPAEFVTPSDKDHDWRTEQWVDDHGPSDLDCTQAFAIAAALAMDGDNPQQEEDCKVFALVCPELFEPFWRGGGMKDAIRHRLVQAISQCLNKTRKQWIVRYGSAEAKGRRRHKPEFN